MVGSGTIIAIDIAFGLQLPRCSRLSLCLVVNIRAYVWYGHDDEQGQSALYFLAMKKQGKYVRTSRT